MTSLKNLQIQSNIRSMSLLKSAQDESNTINIFFFISFMFVTLSVSKTTTYTFPLFLTTLKTSMGRYRLDLYSWSWDLRLNFVALWRMYILMYLQLNLVFLKRKQKNYNNLFIFEILTYTSFYKNFFNVMSGITFMSSKTTKNQIILPRKNSLATVYID